MSRKSFNVCVVFDILDVTCPGVCICPRGMVYLDIWLFGHNNSTSYVEPKFPLVFNETFSFHENFAKAFDLRGVQKCLEDKYMQIALTQVYKNKQVTLAVYNSNVDEVLYPQRTQSNRNGETILFMKNEPLFPGTISPKITVITKTSVTEQMHTILQSNHCSSQNLETQNRSNRMKIVHHSKPMDSTSFYEIDNSDTDSTSEEKKFRRPKHEKHKHSEEEPRKINPKIKAQLHLDVYHCKCGMLSCSTSPSWRNICNEVNSKDTVDEIKYHESLRNYYRRLYDGATYQLSRNLKLL